MTSCFGEQVQVIQVEDLPASPPGRCGWPWTEGTRVAGEAGRFPPVSVVTPSYNQAAFLEETIRSVLLQGYPNLEYGVMDGGSTDGSVEIIRKYAPFLSFWQSQPDKGQTDAINRGMEKCSGFILAYLNSDDVYEPGAFQTVAPLFEQDAADVVYGGFVAIDETGTVRARYQAHPFDAGRLLLDNTIAQPSTFWSANVQETIGEFDARLHYSMDYDYWMRACAAGFRFKNTDQCLSRFRFHSGSKTVAHAASFGDDILVSLRSLEERGTLPEAMNAMMPRAICRAGWRAAVACYANGDTGSARRHVESAILSVPNHPNDEELEIAFQLCAVSAEGVVDPREFRRRKNGLGLQRGGASSAWRERLNREYNERSVTGSPSPGRIVMALMDDPRRLLNWGFRRALIALSKSLFVGFRQ